MRRNADLFAVCAVAAALLLAGASRASAVGALPTPREDVTKLVKPTLSYCTPDGYEIRLIDWDGENDRVWLSDGKARFSGGVVWTPDGKRAAAVVYDGDYAPYVLELKTGNVQNMLKWLPQNAAGDYIHAAWSPDGIWLTLIADRRITNTIIHADIYKVNAVNGRYVRMTNFPKLQPSHPVWSPDGKRLAFYGLNEPKENGGHVNYEVYTVNADGSNLVNLTNHPTLDKVRSWSPDGKKIVFRSWRSVLDGAEPKNVPDLYMMNPDGSDVERLTFSAALEFDASWSPDSQWIVYASSPADTDDPADEGIYRLRVATKEVQLIKRVQADNVAWVLAGKSRFLSVDPAGKKKAQWGALKAADAEETPMEKNASADE